MRGIRSFHQLALVASGLLVSTCLAAEEPMTQSSNGQITVTVVPANGEITLSGRTGEVFAHGTLRGKPTTVTAQQVHDPRLGDGKMVVIAYAEGGRDQITLYPERPFAFIQPIFAHHETQRVVLNRIPVLKLSLHRATPPAGLVSLGTGGLIPPAQAPASYAWMAVAEPISRVGIVAGWITHERGSGIIAGAVENGAVTLAGRAEYGRLVVEPKAEVPGEVLAVGEFSDARLGLEAWASTVGEVLAIKLPPQPIVYCTWYDNVHGRASNEKAIAELSEFAARSLKPFGLSCIQIDDGWQMGDPKGNGPKKNFSEFNPNGPFPGGMQATAAAITGYGFTPGLWILPFGGTWNDPFFAPHQEWFVKRQADGKPFDTPWGGTCLDMTQPGAREFVRGEISQAVGTWGYRYLKLDGLSTGCGVRPQYVNAGWKEDDLGDAVFSDPSKANVEVFRGGLRLIRQATGPGTFILGCAAPQNMRSYAGVFGLVDGMRMGPDNSGSWEGWFRSSPLFGSRNYHLNGRIWWSDPDPIYVRPALPLVSAQCIASWNALAGQMISLSDWLPTLPPERLEIIKRVIPGHGVTARPIDLFEHQPQQSWLVTDERQGRQRRDLLGLFNWDQAATVQRVALNRLALPPAERYIGFDFWGDTFLKPFSDSLELDVPGHGCRIAAIRPLLARPFLLSTSRHVSQGILEVQDEAWDATSMTLRGTSALVAADPYELRLVAQAPNATWSVAGVNVAPEDRTAGVTESFTAQGGLVRVRLLSPTSRTVAWNVRFTRSVATTAIAPPAVAGLTWTPAEDRESLTWTWNRIDGAECELMIGKQAPIRMATAAFVSAAPEPGVPVTVTATVVTWDGKRSDPTTITVTVPPGQPIPPKPAKPTISLNSLTAVLAKTKEGRANARMSVDGGPLTIAGDVFADGIGVHAPAELVYVVKPEYRRFVATVGLDDEVKGSQAAVVFSVVAELAKGKRKVLATSPKLRSERKDPTWRFDLPLPPGCEKLHLVVEDQDPTQSNRGHADWADAGFITAP
jgi:NPCBM/NEW2 domain/Melibiase